MYPSNGGEKAMKMLRGIAKKTKSPIAEELAKENEFATAKEVACQLFYEAMDEFQEGDMSWAEVIKDLYENLKAIPMPDAPKDGESEGD
jgi:hypothetical protein